MSDSDSDESQGVQVRVSLKLAPSVADRTLEVPSEPIAVPADIGRQGLSAVLNHLLGRSVTKGGKGSDSDSDDDDDDNDKLPPLNFEFILGSNKATNNRLLRKGVEKEARQNGIGLEEAIQITYFPASNVPELSGDDETLPDWVSCLSLLSSSSSSSLLFSGCYDGSLNIYQRNADSGLEKLHSTTASSGPIKCLRTVQLEDKTYIASASLDHTLNIHTYSADSSSNGLLQSYGQCLQEGMSNPISSLDFSSSAYSNGNKSGPLLLASGDGNGVINIWDITKEVEDIDVTVEEGAKKRKTKSGSKNSGNSKKNISASISIESAHSQLVSGLSWGNHHHHHHHDNNNNNTHLISGSWDHSIKLWDVTKQDCILTLNGSRVVSCLDTSYHSEGVVATGHPDCTIRLWDVRTNTSQQSAVVSDSSTFRPSHRAWVSSVHWSQSNAYQLASASHDGTVKLWDIRSSNPLHTVRAFPKEEKALCLVWGSSSSSSSEEDGGKEHLFAGGTDCIIKQIKV